MRTPIRVVSRVHPTEESNGNSSSDIWFKNVIEVSSATSQIIIGHDHFCDFDTVFGPDVSQKELYTASVEDLVAKFFDGYNVSVVGYGGCGSGKTFTITGPGFLWAINEEEFGLLPRAVRQLFRHIAECHPHNRRRVHVSVSYLLLSAGAVFDLLASQPVLTPLPILADHKGSVLVPGLSSVECSSINEVLNCLEAGLLARHNHANSIAGHTPSTATRTHCSHVGGSPLHTHASFTITLQQQVLDEEGKTRVLCSRLNFVDLAGVDQKAPSLDNIRIPGSNNSQSQHEHPQHPRLSTTSNSSITLSNNLFNSYQNRSIDCSLQSDLLQIPGGASGNEGISNEAPNLVTSYSETRVLGGVASVPGSRTNSIDDGGKGGEDYLGDFSRRDSSDQQLATGAEVELEDVATVFGGGAAGCGVVLTADHQCLASVISSLVENQGTGPVPYAHSMLTQLLKEGFGGNCLTLVVCCISPLRRHLPATLLALKYATLARHVLNTPTVNDITEQLTSGSNEETVTVVGGSEGGSAPSFISSSEDSIKTTIFNTNAAIGPTKNTVPVAADNTNNNSHNSGTAGDSNGSLYNDIHNNTTTTASSSRSNIDSGRTADPEEIFRLQFVGLQLQQLVDGADALLRASLPLLPPPLQARAGAWLCKRSEAAHCLGPALMQASTHYQQSMAAHYQHTAVHNQYAAYGWPLLPFAGSQQHLNQQRDDRVLHVIEELSEPGDLRNSSQNNSSSAGTPAAVTRPRTARSCSPSPSSSGSSLGEEFHEQLAVLTAQFAVQTVGLVRAVEDRLDCFSEHMTSAAPSSDDETPPLRASNTTARDKQRVSSEDEKVDLERCHGKDKVAGKEDDDCGVITQDVGTRKLNGESRFVKETDGVLNDTNRQDDAIDCNVGPDNNVQRCSDNSRGDGEGSDGEGPWSEKDSDADMESFDSEEDEETCSSAYDEDAEEVQKHPTSHSLPPLFCTVGSSNNSLAGGKRLSERRGSAAGLGGSLPSHVTHPQQPLRQEREQRGRHGLLDGVSAVALHVHEANRRKQRELKETIREKESQLRSLQRGVREKEALVQQNMARLTQLQHSIASEVALVSEARARLQCAKGDRRAKQEASTALQQHQRLLQQHRDRGEAITSFLSIIEANKTDPVEVWSLSARLQELRSELAEVETTVRVDGQRKQRLQGLCNNRSNRETSGQHSADEDMEHDLEDPFEADQPLHDPLTVFCGPTTKGSSKPLKHRANTGHSSAGAGSGSTAWREDSEATRDDAARRERVTLHRVVLDAGSRAVVSVHGSSQPHKRRLVTTSSSEQCSSSAEDGNGSRGSSQQLRAEIAQLREARDLLAACRQRLNRKVARGVRASLQLTAERRLLELDEAVEAVDSSIEYKNELLCGRDTELAATSQLLLQGQLLDRVLNLSMEEIRALLVKYFNRVVDIRIEFRKQEVAYTELEVQYEQQCRRVQKLDWSYQQASLDMERRCAVQQRQHLHRLHRLLRHIHSRETVQLAWDPPASSAHPARELEMNLFYYKDQCALLKSLLRNQQEQGQNFQPVFQQLQQPCQQDVAGDGLEDGRGGGEEMGRHDGVTLKLSSLDPGPSVLTASRVHNDNRDQPQQAGPSSSGLHQHKKHPLPAVDQHSGGGHNPRPGSAPHNNSSSHHHSAYLGTSSHLLPNPFPRRLEPRPRRRPPSAASRYFRGLATHRRGGSLQGGTGETIPLTRTDYSGARHQQQLEQQRQEDVARQQVIGEGVRRDLGRLVEGQWML